MTIGVTAATGQLGRLVIEELKSRVDPAQIVALVRTPAKAADLGVAVREADYAQPQTLAAALEGVDALLLISSNEIGERIAQHQNVIDAARAAGVGRIVYTSILHADDTPISLGVDHRATEAAIKASGLPYTLLRNGWYTENFTSGVPGAVAGGALVNCAGEAKLSLAARADYAAAAAKVLCEPGHEGKTYELAGDIAYTLSDLAAEISRQTGRDIPYRNLSQSDYAALLQGFGLPAGFANSVASWSVEASHGALFDDSHQLSTLIGRSTTPLAVDVAKALTPGTAA